MNRKDAYIELQNKFKARIIDKGFSEEEASELIKERTRLQKKVFKNGTTYIVSQKCTHVKRLSQINHLIFGAK